MRNGNNLAVDISNNKNKKNNNKNQKDPLILTSLESKKYNDFLGVFGAHADNSKYFKPKKIITKAQCQTPNKKEIKNSVLDNNSLTEMQNAKRKCKSPFKLNNFLFLKKNNETIQNKNLINVNKTEEKNINKNKKEIKNKVKSEIKIYDLSFYEPFKEDVKLLDGEGNSYDVIFVRNEFEIMLIFNENKFNSFNDIHFTNDFFSFPQYCIDQVKYNPDTKTTLIKLKDYRCFKIQTLNEEFFLKISFNPKSRIDFFKYAFLYNALIKEKNEPYPIDGWNIYNPF